jgi:hypothetical protein
MKILIIIIFTCFVSFVNINAQWATNPDSILQITDWSRLPFDIASDGKGGVFISIDKDIIPFPEDTIPAKYAYLLALDKYGYKKWDEPIRFGAEDNQEKVKLVPDGEGGAIAGILDLDFERWSGIIRVWDWKIRAQRFDSLGNKLWGDGVLVSTDTTDHYAFDIMPDGEGGCYISWLSEKTMDYINSDGYRALQHISAQGERMWSDTGMVLYSGPVANFSYYNYQIVPDNFGGFYAINTPNSEDHYLIRISNEGAILFETISRIGGWITGFKATNKGDLLIFANIWDDLFDYVTIKVDNLDSNGQYSWELPITFADSVGGKSDIIDIFFNADYSASVYWRDQNIVPHDQYSSYYQKISADGQFGFAGYGLSLKPYSPNLIWAERMIRSDDEYILIFIDDGLQAQKITVDGTEVWDEAIFVSNLGASDRRYTTDMNGGFLYVFIIDLNGLWAQQVSSSGLLGDVATYIKSSNFSLPSKYELLQNYPNPFNPLTTIEFTLPKSEEVKIEIFNTLGQKIYVLLNQHMKAGNHEVEFNVANLSSGIYFYRIEAGEFQDVKKMIMLK